ncbi:MAG: O-methyltransferase [Kofleriaceae bacterium]
MADSSSRAGERYAAPEILDYVAKVHASHDEGLARAFAVPEGVPAIMLGPSEGRLLQLLARLAGVRKAVEVGTLVGYSATQLARGMDPSGHLWTIESDAHHAEVARGNLQAAGVGERVTVLHGGALTVLPTLAQHAPFDLVFIDADKENYPHYAAWGLEHLRQGGLLLGDNAFLFGNLLELGGRGPAMRAFHEMVADRCDSVCIPTPDGLVLGVKR